MKTAMQMMLDDLISKREVHENATLYQCVATLETSIEIAKHLIEKEKEQITKAYNSAIPFKFGEEYYNQTYNQNK
jgi:uncharacterized protein YutE (UPF0331/DUF86 family)